MNTEIYQGHNSLKPNLSGIFQKAVIVKGGTVRFQHDGKDYHLTCPALAALEGLTVLVNSAMEITRSGVLIGVGTEPR